MARRLAELAVVLFVVTADGAATWGVQTTDASSWRAQIPRAPRQDDTYRNLDPKFPARV
jgi:hypothetical protein